MTRHTIAALLLAFSGAAFASSCPLLMQDIDAALEDRAVTESLGEEAIDKARQLREEGEEAHRSGDHQLSMQKLAEAKRVLGIE
jgi:hypothetical protein